LRSGLADEGFRGTLLVSQAYGGLLPFDEAAKSPVGMIESGPVSGLVGSQHLGELIGVRDIIAADMGGTTFKVGMVREGRIEYQRESMVLRYHYALPKMDVVSLGLAGGSIVWIDPRTGAPRIGPRSAGSYPGPVCYGHGGDEPTITDVDAVLGFLNPDFFFAGREGLDVERARAAIEERIAKPLKMDVIEAAAAMYRLANSLIHDLLHKTTVQRGLDPRGFSLFSFGGTAGMHVGAYSAELGVAQVVVPNSASVHGAFGLITSDIVHEDQITRPLRAPIDPAVVTHLFEELGERVTAQLRSEGFDDDQITLRRSIEMRYRRQVHMLTVPLAFEGPIDEAGLAKTIDLFESLYEQKYGEQSAYREAGIEAVSFRLRGLGAVGKPRLRTHEIGGSQTTEALAKRVDAWVEAAGEIQEVPGYDFGAMVPGSVLAGPAVVWSPITTLVVPAGQSVRVDEYRNMVMAPESAEGAELRGRVASRAGVPNP
ncbi:MAG: hydantoinase/oxoprolinase family protein, partial [Solirubrobacteraceae bacterium]